MQALSKTYASELEALAVEIQASEELQAYLEEEEEEQYLALKELFEPRIAEIYEQVAAKDPLQLTELETFLLKPEFEGLYLPKILGFTVLRGDINMEKMKYARPQHHFQKVLMAICESANFDLLRKRIGQSIQMGFALSSDIWVTSLISNIENKRVRNFLQGQKLDRYHLVEERLTGYTRYQRQFQSENFMCAEFPKTLPDLKVLYSHLKQFLLYRAKGGYDNSSVIPELRSFVENPDFKGQLEHLEVMVLYAFFFDLDKKDQDQLSKHFNEVRSSMPEFEEQYFEYLLSMYLGDKVAITPEADARMSAVIDRSIKDQLSHYYDLMDELHGKGHDDEAVQEAVKAFYVNYEGLSTINECVRQTVYTYFERDIKKLDKEGYPTFFEIAKLYPIYMSIFANQQFNQQLKELSLAYVGKLLKHYTDKRGKDYQDIKKFVATTFQDLGFLKEKEVVEMFKTRRTRRKTAS